MKTYGMLSVAVVFALIVNGSWAWSQQIQIAPAMAVGGQPLDLAAAMKEQLAQQKKVWQSEMTVLLADVDRVCTLTSEQKAKLEVAAKGAIEKSFQLVKEEQEKMMAQFGQMGGIAAQRIDRVEREEEVDNDEAEADKKEEQGADEAAGQADVGGGIAVAAAGQVVRVQMAAPAAAGVANSHNPADQEVWKKTLKLTLSADQSGRYEEVIKTRATQAQEARLAAFLARVNAKLLLAPEQVDRLRELVARDYGDVELNQAGPDFAGIMINGLAQNSEPFVKEVTKVLSPAQLELWLANFQSGLDFAKMVGRQAGGGRAIMFPAMPLAPAAPVIDN